MTLKIYLRRKHLPEAPLHGGEPHLAPAIWFQAIGSNW